MKHVPGIDVWRGVSVLLVITHHVAIRLPLKATPLASWVPLRLLMAISWNGYEAVMIFFVISGFLITTRTLDRDGSPAEVDPRAFWSRRVARIAPPLLALLGVLSALHLAGWKDYAIDPTRQSLGWALLSASTFWLHVYEARTGYLPGNWDVLWSLSIEELFYLGFPWLFRAARREWVVAAILVPFVAAMPMWRLLAGEGIRQEKATLPGMAAIAAGVVAALVVRRLPVSPWRDRAATAVGSALLLSVLVWGDLWWERIGEGTLLVHLLGAVLVVGGAAPSRGAPWRWTAPLRSLGRLSYEIYLTHMFVVFSLVWAWHAAGWGKAEGALVTPLAVLGSWGLGWVFARVWSVPADRWVRARLLGTTPARPFA